MCMGVINPVNRLIRLIKAGLLSVKLCIYFIYIKLGYSQGNPPCF